MFLLLESYFIFFNRNLLFQNEWLLGRFQFFKKRFHHCDRRLGLVLFYVLHNGNDPIDPFLYQSFQCLHFRPDGFIGRNPIVLKKIEHQKQDHRLGSGHFLAKPSKFHGHGSLDFQGLKPFFFKPFIHPF